MKTKIGFMKGPIINYPGSATVGGSNAFDTESRAM